MITHQTIHQTIIYSLEFGIAFGFGNIAGDALVGWRYWGALFMAVIATSIVDSIGRLL